MNSLMKRVEISPERQRNERIEFRFPVYFKDSEITGLGWNKSDMSRTVTLLPRLSGA